MSAELVVDQGSREPQTGVQRLFKGVVLSAIGIIDIRELASLNQVHECLTSFRLPRLDVNVLAVVAGPQRIALDLWLHDAFLDVSEMLTGSQALVNGNPCLAAFKVAFAVFGTQAVSNG
ncbi:hypothetical protein [Stenotrophomonas maltophilia]|uniref:hypothetical protein n=1 Tax=Stenotrophomonas maltophilia TaxID=40324 RepID=UPI000F77DF42|nr:hypothetical protein [Stenotrophomonas maltophilia]